MSARLPLLAVRFSFLRGLLRDQAKRPKAVGAPTAATIWKARPLSPVGPPRSTGTARQLGTMPHHDPRNRRSSPSPRPAGKHDGWTDCPPRCPTGTLRGSGCRFRRPALGCVCVGRGGVGEKPFEGFASTGPAPKKTYRSKKRHPIKRLMRLVMGARNAAAERCTAVSQHLMRPAVVASDKSWSSTRIAMVSNSADSGASVRSS